MSTTSDQQTLCIWCHGELLDGSGRPSFIYNAAFDQVAKVHTACLGDMVQRANNARRLEQLRAERDLLPGEAAVIRRKLDRELLANDPGARLRVVR